MEKQIIRWTYLLGLVCVVVALLWRAAGLMGAGPGQFNMGSSFVTYMSFFKAAVLFLLTSIATAHCVASQKG